jgi:hypothetical protein
VNQFAAAGPRPADNPQYDEILSNMAGSQGFATVQDFESYMNDGPGNANLASFLGLGSDAVPGSVQYTGFMLYSLWMISHQVAPYAAVAAAPAPAATAAQPSATNASTTPPAASSSSANAGVVVEGANNAPPGIVSTLTTYFNAVNSGDYATAYAQFGPQEQATQGESQFAANMATSQDSNIAIGVVSATSSGSYLVNVSFTSTQSADKGSNGDQCDNWTLQYTMINSGGTWLINAANGQNGVTHAVCA